jgi:hypothetical protein
MEASNEPVLASPAYDRMCRLASYIIAAFFGLTTGAFLVLLFITLNQHHSVLDILLVVALLVQNLYLLWACIKRFMEHDFGSN